MTHDAILLKLAFIHQELKVFVVQEAHAKIAFWYVFFILLTITESLYIVLVKRIAFLFMSAKLAAQGFLETKLFKISVMTFLSMTLPLKYYCVTQITLHMQSCDQGLVTLAFPGEKLIFYYFILINIWQRETNFFGGWPCFKFNNLALAVGMTFKFLQQCDKKFKPKIKRFWGQNLLVQNLQEKDWWGNAFCPLPQYWIGLNGFNF